MRNNFFLPWVLFFCFLSQGIFLGCSDVKEEFDLDELENYLKTAKVVSIEIKESVGRTAPWEVTLDDGKTQRRGRFKYVRRSRPHHLPDSYHYEIAAYQLTKLLGVQMIPPVVEREIDNTMGSLQMYVEGCFRLSDQKRKGLEPPDQEIFMNTLHELSVLENLTYCVRDKKDILVKEKTWHVCRVDFSEAFSPEIALIPDSEIMCCSKILFKGLSDLSDDAIQSKLSRHLNSEEINALLIRRTLILEKLKSLIAERGEEKVLF